MMMTQDGCFFLAQPGKVAPSRSGCTLMAVKQPFSDEAWDVEWAQLPAQQHQLRLVPWGAPQYEHEQMLLTQQRSQQQQQQHKHQRQQPQQQSQQQQKQHDRKNDSYEVDEDRHEPHHNLRSQPSVSSHASPEEMVASGDLPSIGSSGHATGECKRCAFFPKGRCLNGADCTHCHFPHDERRRRRNRRQHNVANTVLHKSGEVLGPVEVSGGAAPVDLMIGTPVVLPPHVTSDAAITFGAFTPEMAKDPMCGVCTRANQMVVEEQEPSDDGSTCSEPTCSLAFASLMEGHTSSSDQMLAPSEDDAEACPVEEQLSAEEKYLRDLEEEAEAAEAEAIRLEKEALEALANLEKSVASAVPEVSHDKIRRLEQCALSESDSGNITEPTAAGDSSAPHALSSECDTASDSDAAMSHALDVVILPPEEIVAGERAGKRQERRQSSKGTAEKRSSKCHVRSPLCRVRSPLWPSKVPMLEGNTSETVTTSWAAAAQKRRSTQKDAGIEDLARKARGILNKLTPTRFDTLYEQLLSCEVRTSTQLQVIVAEIFEKATIQHCFLPMYVDLCVRLDAHFRSKPIEGADFRKVLVGECQRTFERNLQVPTFDGILDPEERYEAEVKFKTRMLGNLRFVGELLVKKLLAGKVLLAVAEELLAIGSAEGIEAAATLLTVAGPAFDRSSWTFVPRLHAIFALLRPLSQDPMIPARVRCILKDLLELRSRGWTEKR